MKEKKNELNRKFLKIYNFYFMIFQIINLYSKPLSSVSNDKEQISPQQNKRKKKKKK